MLLASTSALPAPTETQVAQLEGETAPFASNVRSETRRAYTVNVNGSDATVVSAFDNAPKYKITQEGNTTRVDSGFEEGNFTFTRKDDGSIFIDGQLKPQDFDIKREGGKLVVQGYYPQQRYVIG